MASQGQCSWSPAYMLDKCKKSCNCWVPVSTLEGSGVKPVVKVEGKRCTNKSPKYWISQGSYPSLTACSLSCEKTDGCREISINSGGFCILHQEGCIYENQSEYKVYTVGAPAAD